MFLISRFLVVFAVCAFMYVPVAHGGKFADLATKPTNRTDNEYLAVGKNNAGTNIVVQCGSDKGYADENFALYRLVNGKIKTSVCRTVSWTHLGNEWVTTGPAKWCADNVCPAGRKVANFKDNTNYGVCAPAGYQVKSIGSYGIVTDGVKNIERLGCLVKGNTAKKRSAGTCSEGSVSCLAKQTGAKNCYNKCHADGVGDTIMIVECNKGWLLDKINKKWKTADGKNLYSKCVRDIATIENVRTYKKSDQKTGTGAKYYPLSDSEYIRCDANYGGVPHNGVVYEVGKNLMVKAKKCDVGKVYNSWEDINNLIYCTDNKCPAGSTQMDFKWEEKVKICVPSHLKGKQVGSKLVAGGQGCIIVPGDSRKKYSNDAIAQRAQRANLGDQYGNYYDVCDTNKGQFGAAYEHCVDQAFADIKVTDAQARALAALWAKKKHDGMSLVCGAKSITILDFSKVTSPYYNDDFLTCVDEKTGRHKFSFRFDTITAFYDDVEVQQSTAHGVAAVLGYANAVVKKGQTYNLKTRDCVEFSAELKDFGYGAKIVGDVCQVKFNGISNKYDLKTIDGVNNMYFKDERFSLNSFAEGMLRNYVANSLDREPKSFEWRCDRSFVILQDKISGDKGHVLKCYYRNNQEIDFVFKSLTTGDNRADAIAQGHLACLSIKGGVYRGSKCHGIEKEKCNRKDMGGLDVKWNKIYSVCEVVKASKAIYQDGMGQALKDLGICTIDVVGGLLSGDPKTLLYAATSCASRQIHASAVADSRAKIERLITAANDKNNCPCNDYGKLTACVNTFNEGLVGMNAAGLTDNDKTAIAEQYTRFTKCLRQLTGVEPENVKQFREMGCFDYDKLDENGKVQCVAGVAEVVFAMLAIGKGVPDAVKQIFETGPLKFQHLVKAYLDGDALNDNVRTFLSSPRVLYGK